MKKLSIIIVNYNTCGILKDCLRNLEDIYPDMEVIVVDNASPDKSAEMVKNEYPQVKLIELANNKGLAAGSNIGMEEASGDYILYLGSDAFPQKNTISGMVEYMENHMDTGAATCKLVLRDGKTDMDAHRGFPTPWASLTHFAGLNKLFPASKIFNQYFLGGRNLNEPHEIDLCISHFMLIKKEVLNKVGRWDEDFFVYGEDVDMCYRIKQAGWKIMYLPQFEAIHYKGVSVGIRKETKNISTTPKEIRRKMVKQTTTAMKLFYEKHYKNKYPQYVTGLVFMGINLIEKIRSIKME